MTGAPASILVYSMGEILGDGIWKLPLLAGLRAAAPQARLVWAAAHPQGTVYSGPLKRLAAPLLDAIVTGPGAGAHARDLFRLAPPFAGERFDLVIDTQARLAPALVARRAARARFISAAAGFILSSARPDAAWPAAGRDQVAALFGLGLGLPGPITPAPLPLVTPEAAEAARALLPEGETYVGLSPGAGGENRRWPLAHFIALARALAGQGLRPVFFLGPLEAGWADAIREGCRHALLPEQTGAAVRGPDLVFALAARLRAAVANDSGTGHMLGLGGARLLTLYRTHRLAAKFPTWSPAPGVLAAQDFGSDAIEAIGLEAVQAALAALLTDE